MMNAAKLSLLLATSSLFLAGCVDGLSPYRQSPDTVIATGIDRGRDSGVLANGGAAIAYDPDGCQNWLIDDGIEGYSSPRYDPATGLPICNNLYPPGTVLREYRRGGAGLQDYTPRPGVTTVVRRQGDVAN